MFAKVLVANRGEIAVRVLRALREMGIRGVAAYPQGDRTALHVRMAEEAALVASYLDIPSILDAARRHKVEAIHPGYGFLSENAEFASACEAAGIVFIGPSPAAIHSMGLKTEARRVAKRAGVPVVPGTDAPVETLSEARRIAAEIGYPVMLKADAGGGGKGMRRVMDESSLEAAFRDAASEAERSFRNGAVYLEKLIVEPRHIEIQVLGDRFGNLIHLGERECSLQRRHQKLLEESPSPLVNANPEMRRAMGEAAVKAAGAAGYYNAGTVEFLADAGRNFYFLEMNTRLQVEHPVTELVTGLDLVQWQVRIAAGERLTLCQEDISWRGAAIECRVCAEDPERQFMPSPGLIERLVEPSGPGVRLDSGVFEGWRVPVEFDPLLAKLIVCAPSRELAIARMKRALSEYVVGGIKTNLSFFREILDTSAFRNGQIHTGFIDGYLRNRAEKPPTPELDLVAALVAAVHAASSKPTKPVTTESAGRWLSEGRSHVLR